MMNKRKKRETKKLNKNVRSALKEKLAVLILLREDINAQERFAEDLAERKELVQQIIIVAHKIQALRTVISLFSDDS
jgi:hypothetical protein